VALIRGAAFQVVAGRCSPVGLDARVGKASRESVLGLASEEGDERAGTGSSVSDGKGSGAPSSAACFFYGDARNCQVSQLK
jgi:hypothetical protein